MRERLIVLREHRARLLEQAAVEREQLGAMVDRTDAASRWLATGAHMVEEAKQHPLWIVAAGAFLLALRPRRVLGWLMKGWTLYQVYRKGRALLERIAPGLAAAVRAP